MNVLAVLLRVKLVDRRTTIDVGALSLFGICAPERNTRARSREGDRRCFFIGRFRFGVRSVRVADDCDDMSRYGSSGFREKLKSKSRPSCLRHPVGVCPVAFRSTAGRAIATICDSGENGFWAEPLSGSARVLRRAPAWNPAAATPGKTRQKPRSRVRRDQVLFRNKHSISLINQPV